MKRQNTSVHRLSDKPHINDAKVKIITDAVKYTRRPNKSDSILVRGIMITFEMAYDVVTQAISVVVAPILPLISRNDTFTMVVSMSSRMAQLMAVITVIHFTNPVG